MHRRPAFTLIELLVVVTIIVVLLALLTPALDQAIYQADVAMCGAKLHATAGGTIVYAADNKRHYPDRVGPKGWDFAKLSGGGQPVTNRFDDRPILRTYLSLNGHLRDPIDPKVDMEAPGPNAGVYASYALWFGWRYTDPARGGGGMYRIGDRFTWSERGRSSAFDLLASDWDDEQQSTNYVFASHPSKDGAMTAL